MRETCVHPHLALASVQRATSKNQADRHHVKINGSEAGSEARLLRRRALSLTPNAFLLTIDMSFLRGSAPPSGAVNPERIELATAE